MSSDLLLPTEFLLEDDGVSVWGYVRATVENHTLMKVEFALAEKNPLEWNLFCQMTVVQGRIAFNMPSFQRTGEIDGTGRLKPLSETGRIVLTAAQKDWDERNQQGDDSPLRPRTVGEDSHHPHVAGESPDPGERAGGDKGT